jgi:outer membrane protein TolC
MIAQDIDSASQDQAKQSDTDDLPPLPLSPIEKAEEEGTALLMSLRDVTKMALQYNLDIAIQDTNEETSQLQLVAAEAAYDPSLTFNLSLNSRRGANTNRATANPTQDFYTSRSIQWSAGFSQPLKTGGSLDVSWDTNRQSSDTDFSLLNPSYSAGASVTFNQPLWQNLRIDQNRGNIKLRKLDLETTDSQFKQTVTSTIANIQSTYWDLVAAIEDYKIKRSSVELAQINLRDNKKKVEVGTMAPIEVTDAEANVASREVQLITAEEAILRQENALRRLISNDRNHEIWSKVIVPIDTPDFSEYKVDPFTAINSALKNRPELEQYDIQLRQSDISLKMNDNSRKWLVNLVGTFGSSGEAGEPQPTGPPQPERRIGGIGQAYNNLFSEGLINWTVRVNLDIPLRNRAADSQYAQQMISRRKIQMQRKNQEQQIQVEIRNALQSIETNRKQVETAGVARRLAEERLDGEEKRFEAGLSQNYLVLQRQNELSSAQYTELQALINYKKAIINLQQSMYTLLESNEFEIAKDSSSNVPDLK